MHEDQARRKTPISTPGSILLIQPDSLARMLEQVDGAATGLNGIGLAIVEAGLTGVRGFPVGGSHILWQVRRDTPEGVYFAWVCERAKRGLRLPSVGHVLEIIRRSANPNEGLAQ